MPEDHAQSPSSNANPAASDDAAESSGTDAKPKWRTAVESHHKLQMDHPEADFGAIDPDPPQPLAERLAYLEKPILTLLGIRGWPSRPGRPPPQRCKGRTLAKKLMPTATEEEITALADRINWLQNNDFRWAMRDGYPAYFSEREARTERSQKHDEAEENEPSELSAEHDSSSLARSHSPSSVTDPTTESHDGSASPEGSSVPGPKGNDTAPAASAYDMIDAPSDPVTEVVRPTSGHAETRSSETSRLHVEGDERGKTTDAETPSNRLAPGGSSIPPPPPVADDRRGPHAAAASSSKDDPAGAPAKTAPLRSGSQIPATPNFTINSIPSTKGRAFLLDIYYQKDIPIVMDKAVALRDDKHELSITLSHSEEVKAYIIDAFAELGLDLDA